MKAAGGGDSGSSEHNFHFHATTNSIDSRGVKEFIDKNLRAFGRAGQKYLRGRAR
jgi:hypothetical protein